MSSKPTDDKQANGAQKDGSTKKDTEPKIEDKLV